VGEHEKVTSGAEDKEVISLFKSLEDDSEHVGYGLLLYFWLTDFEVALLTYLLSHSLAGIWYDWAQVLSASLFYAGVRALESSDLRYATAMLRFLTKYEIYSSLKSDVGTVAQ